LKINTVRKANTLDDSVCQVNVVLKFVGRAVKVWWKMN